MNALAHKRAPGISTTQSCSGIAARTSQLNRSDLDAPDVPPMTRPALIPPGLWPPRMPVEMAAGYCGEKTAEVFLAQVRAGAYPGPVVKRGRRQIWLKEDLDQVIMCRDGGAAADAALDL